ncbi:M50 family metallopeptidase [Mucilaginibacter gilvus]|uniref:M50 family peptidase n=1 Tax=Mucilaginibacter gilvus TaxID=2305909 RepID=A0A3S4YFL2_9SPHI|nr:M50 family metallopeptidase [Mucilaginibacter gilvus]RWY54102.1 M50 family peptidase [Mucilaginibacter gilvus]
MKLTRLKPFLVVAFLLLLTADASALGFALFPKGEKPNGLLVGGITIVALFIAIAIHELGHLLTGLAQGFRFELFIVGLLGIKRENGRIKVYLNKDLGMMGGVAATMPVQQSAENRKKFARLVIAGPLASLFFGVTGILIGIYCEPDLASAFWIAAGACSLALVLATTLPTKTGIFFTDRARYQRLISKGKAGAIEEAMLAMMAQYTADSSAKNIDIKHARLLQTDDEQFMRFWGYYYEYYYYKDNLLIADAADAKAKLVAEKASVSRQIWKALKIDDEVNPSA